MIIVQALIILLAAGAWVLFLLYRKKEIVYKIPLSAAFIVVVALARYYESLIGEKVVIGTISRITNIGELLTDPAFVLLGINSFLLSWLLTFLLLSVIADWMRNLRSLPRRQWLWGIPLFYIGLSVLLVMDMSAMASVPLRFIIYNFLYAFFSLLATFQILYWVVPFIFVGTALVSTILAPTATSSGVSRSGGDSFVVGTAITPRGGKLFRFSFVTFLASGYVLFVMGLLMALSYSGYFSDELSQGESNFIQGQYEP